MSASSQAKHAPPAKQGAGNAPAVADPAYSERARTLLHTGRIGSLSTLSRKQPGFPFGSLMPYGLDERGRTVFLISTMAMHTQNLLADPRASLLVVQPDAEGDPLGASRVTLMGKVAQVPDAEKPAARSLYLARYESSRYWVDFADFAFYRMDVVDVYYVGGFGVMGWITAPEYEAAKVDPLCDDAAAIMTHMNADHRDAMVLLARVFAGVEAEEATMTSVDRLGFHLRVKAEDGVHGIRIAFTREAGNPSETRKVLVEMVQHARQR